MGVMILHREWDLMALIYCSDCGGPVSDLAVACPRCARPMRAPQLSARTPHPVLEAPQDFPMRSVEPIRVVTAKDLPGANDRGVYQVTDMRLKAKVQTIFLGSMTLIMLGMGNVPGVLVLGIFASITGFMWFRLRNN